MKLETETHKQISLTPTLPCAENLIKQLIFFLLY